MLARNNYTAWSLKMKVFMEAQGVWEAVEPDDPKAVVPMKTDKMSLAAIYSSIPEEMLLSLAEKKSAKEAWEAIQTLCVGVERVKAAKVQTLKTEFESLQMKDSDELEEFCMKLNGIVTNIRVLGEKMAESNVVKKLLRAVPTRLLQIASTIEQFGDMETMSVEEVMGRLKAHDERLRGHSENSSGQLLLTQEEWLKRSGKSGTETSQNHRSKIVFDRNTGRNSRFRPGQGYKGRHNKGEQNSRGATGGRER